MDSNDDNNNNNRIRHRARSPMILAGFFVHCFAEGFSQCPGCSDAFSWFCRTLVCSIFHFPGCSDAFRCMVRTLFCRAIHFSINIEMILGGLFVHCFAECSRNSRIVRWFAVDFSHNLVQFLLLSRIFTRFYVNILYTVGRNAQFCAGCSYDFTWIVCTLFYIISIFRPWYDSICILRTPFCRMLHFWKSL